MIHLDFETRSLVDLRIAGIHRYAEDPSTDVLCFSWAKGEEKPKLWVKGHPMPKEFVSYLQSGITFAAWGAPFEITIWEYIMRRKYGWPELPMDRWIDVMGDSAMCGYPLSLDKAAKAIGSSYKKDPAGTRLITKLCKPIKGTTEFRRRKDFPEDFKNLYEYCRQDVRAEREIYHLLPGHVENFPPEMAVQRLTWKINARGIPVDVEAAKIMQKRIQEHTRGINTRVQVLTNGAIQTITQRDKLLMHLEMNRKQADAYLEDREVCRDAGLTVERLSVKKIPSIKLPNAQGETLKKVLDTWDISAYDRELLQMYVDMNHSSAAKIKRLLIQVCADGTIKDNIQYHGAGTGRDAARGFQIQNLPRATDKDPESLLRWFYLQPAEDMNLVFPILESASSLIRALIKAPDGYKIVRSDFSKVEARGSAWTAREEDILQEFRQGVDPYKAMASRMFNAPIEELTSLQYQYGKLVVLACGYQGSFRALQAFAAVYGLEDLGKKEAARYVRKFRRARPRLVSAWKEFNIAAMRAIQEPGFHVFVRGCQRTQFHFYRGNLTMELPSGRKLYYPQARVREVTVKYENENGETREFQTHAVTSMWTNSVTHKWERRQMSGGNFFQNYVQAICRDLLMEACPRLEASGYKIVARVHDEAITITPDDARYSIDEMNDILCKVPEWATGFPIDADGYEAKRYRK